MQRITAPVRLAFRAEGDWWVCYCAKRDTMEGALEMARVAMGIVRDQQRKRDFMEIMKDALSDFIEEKVGARPEMVEEPAPESERSGSA